jgi:hypothetical protein
LADKGASGATTYGKVTERTALEHYCETTGRSVSTGGYFVKKIGNESSGVYKLGYSPDGLVKRSEADNYTKGLVEVKCPFLLKKKKFRYRMRYVFFLFYFILFVKQILFLFFLYMRIIVCALYRLLGILCLS